ncbi:MAG TPA: rhodanese-like domain-containing protein [Nocardioides sp.]
MTTDQNHDLTIIPIETPSLGDRSYVVHDGEVAFVVDPQRDIDRVLALLDEHGVRLTDVFETHIHNDYVTGGLALAQHTGASYRVNGDDEVSFERTAIVDGETVAVGNRMKMRAISTPGHTFTHLSYALTTTGPEGDEPYAVFTGGSLLFGATGRPDLLGEEHTDALVRHQHASAHKLAEQLPDAAEVYPTHGFGSFCSATQSDATESTIGREKQTNPVLTQDEETYVRELLDGLGAWPAYYVHMSPANAAGPDAANLSPVESADADELRRRIEAGEWVIDLRNRTAFAAGHAPGTFNFGLDGAFATYLGWLIEWGTPVTLLGETADDVAEAQRELTRIGIDRPASQATGGPEDWATTELASFPTATFADLADVRHHREVVVLDVRRADEHAGAAIEGAVNIPIHELPRRVAEVPAGEVWVHCASGYRASVAASFLDAAGRTLVAIDDSFENAEQVGLHLISPGADGANA